MTQAAPVVFLLDVDTTLLDNDRIVEDLRLQNDPDALLTVSRASISTPGRGQ